MLKGKVEFELLNEDVITEQKRQCYELLEELHGSFYSQVLREGKLLTNRDTFFSHPDIFRESIFYAADSSFYFQQHAFAVERYQNDSDWLEKNVGFTIEEAARISQAIIVNTHIQAQALQGGFFDAPVTEVCLEAFSISVADLCTMTGIEENKVRRFIDKFSVTATPSNSQYQTIDDYNFSKSHPIIKCPDDKICLLQSHSLCESIYVSPFFWMQQDVKYKTIARGNRGTFLETKILDRLIRVFGAKNVFENVEVFRGKKAVGEIDVLVVYIDRIIVVQAKSKTLTLKAQQGNFTHLENDFKKQFKMPTIKHFRVLRKY